METAHNTNASTDFKDRLSRYFSWAMLLFLIAYLINTVLVHSQKWPGVKSAFSTDIDWRAWVQIGIYLAALLVALLIVSARKSSLRADAATITSINTYLVRSCFWAVLFIGLADMAISFLRVEGYAFTGS